MAYLKQIDEDEVTGGLKQIYDAAKSRAGTVANVIKVMSLDATTTKTSIQLYVSLMKTSFNSW